MNKQLIKIIGHLIFIVLLTAPEKGITAPIMTDSFESGGLSHTENGFVWYSSGRTSVSSDISHTGSHSLKFAFEGKAYDLDASAEQRFDLGAAYPDVWIQFYIYYPDGSEGIGPRYILRSEGNNKFLRLWGSSPNRRDKGLATVEVGASTWTISNQYAKLGSEYASWFNGVSVKHMGQYNTPSYEFVTSSTIGTWIKVKYHAKVASPANNDGVIQIWVNDVLKTDLHTLETYPGNGYLNGYTAGYLLGWANTGFDENTNIYIDDVEISAEAFAQKAAPGFPTNVKATKVTN